MFHQHHVDYVYVNPLKYGRIPCFTNMCRASIYLPCGVVIWIFRLAAANNMRPLR